MVITLTCNPSLDYILTAEKIVPGAVNRAKSAYTTFGGKGLNQSKVLTELGVPNRALALAGGYSGAELDRLLAAHKISRQLIPTKSHTRINVKLRAADETELNAPGGPVEADELASLQKALEALVPGDILSIAGSLPAGIAPDFVENLIEHFSKRGVYTVADVEGAVLGAALEHKPWLIKPNRAEAAALLGLDPQDAYFPFKAVNRLKNLGAQNVLLSLGADGAALLTQDGDFFQLGAPQGKTLGTTGAGDSMLAGFLAGFVWGRPPLHCLHLAVAAGSAAAFAGSLPVKAQIEKTETKMKMR